jgi:hypothetical protein
MDVILWSIAAGAFGWMFGFVCGRWARRRVASMRTTTVRMLTHGDEVIRVERIPDDVQPGDFVTFCHQDGGRDDD